MTYLSHVIETMAGAAALLEHDTTSCRISPMFSALFGAAPTDLRGLAEALTEDPELRQRIELAVAEVRLGIERKLEIPRFSGLKAPGDLHLLPIGDRSRGDVLVIVTSPLSDARLNEAQSRGERLAAMGQLSAGVTHEYNNILTAILGWTQIALRDTSNTTMVNSALAIIEENCLRAKHIIDDLMGFARQEGSEKSSIQLEKVADDVIRLLSWELHNASIFVNRSYGAVPLIKGDRREMFQVFLNLTLNAMRAMPDGGELNISTVHKRGQVTVEVEDTGHGMEEDIAARVFDPLFTTSVTGTGLGLSVCRRIVEDHTGKIAFRSSPGGGTTFTISLPAAERRRSTPADAPTPRVSPPRNIRALVAEDESDVRLMIAKALEGESLSVVSVSNGIEALAACRRQEFDVAILDGSMPNLSTPFLATKLRKAWPEMKIVVASGRPEPPEEIYTWADAFLRKPFTLDQLYRIISEEPS